MEDLKNCLLCPRECGVNRTAGERGVCGAGAELRVARASLHLGEEPCLSGERGSGTIFFSHCSLRCVFCQNYLISQEHHGRDISSARFAEICLELQDAGAHNINLVSPSHYALQLRDGLTAAREGGLSIPVVYNSGGYEKIETLRLLEGLVDIYLPDLKYVDEDLSFKYSGAGDYFAYAAPAILEMYRQAGTPVFGDGGILKKGLLIRHLVLPGLIDNSRKVLDWIAGHLPREVYVSLMGQYTPVGKISLFTELQRAITVREYDDIIAYFFELGLENGYVQEPEAAGTGYIPDFDLRGV